MCEKLARLFVSVKKVIQNEKEVAAIGGKLVAFLQVFCFVVQGDGGGHEVCMPEWYIVYDAGGGGDCILHVSEL